MAEAKESIQVFTQGQHGMLDPTVVNTKYASRLYNVTVRDGLAASAPGLVGADCPVQGRFQGAFEYRLESADYWVVVVSGQVWLHNPEAATWQLMATFPTIDFDQAYFTQADKYAVVQNGIYDPVENWPIILHGNTVVDNLATQYMSGNALVPVSAHAMPETIRVPIGKSMAFGHGRLYVAVDRFYNDGASGDPVVGWKVNQGLRFWMAGDILQVGNPQSILVFTDSYVLARGLAFSLPAEMGFITSMALLRNAESGTGLGALVVFARRGAVAYAVNTTRTNWLSAGFGQVLFTSSGTRSSWALAQVNSDLVYYGDHGLRTLKYSASMESGTGGLASVAISPEVYNFTRLNDSLLHDPFISVAHVDNYFFFTSAGQVLADGSVAFKGILPWDLASFQVSGQPPQQVFAGAWCGRLVHAVIAHRGSTDTLAAIYRDSASGTLKYGTFSPEANSGLVSSVQTAAFVFKSPLQLKRVKNVDAMFDRITGDVAVWVRWRFDGSGAWNLSNIRRFSGSNSSTSLFRIPIEVEDSAGFSIQFAVEWTGIARLKLAIFNATVLDSFYGDSEDMCDTTALDEIALAESTDFGCPENQAGG